MNTSGFTFRQDGLPGLQFNFYNNYYVNIIPDSYSEDGRFENTTVSVTIFNSKDSEEYENKTIDIMEKMGHKPTILDMRTAMFTKVSPEYLLEILRTVVQMEVQ